MTYSGLLLRSMICARDINLGFVSVQITEVMGIDIVLKKYREQKVGGLGQNSEEHQHFIVG